MAARARLDRFGPARRGLIPLGELPVEGEQVVVSLLGRVPKRLDLVDLESALCQLGVGDDLDESLTNLGYPPSPEARLRRERRAATRRVREVVHDAVEAWSEPWSRQWAEAELSGGSFAGLGPDEATSLIESVRAVLDAAGDRPAAQLVDGWQGLASRTDLAARLFGSAHELDDGRPLERLSRRALQHLLSAFDDGDDHNSVIWERAGFHTDLISFPVLTWGLVLQPSPLAELAGTANRAGIPLPISQLALRQHPVSLRSDGGVLVVENPRLVEMAAERRLPFPVITTNGNPRRAPLFLVRQLVESGADVRYHGDFDSAGLSICRTMVAAGCRPLRMTVVDYDRACSDAIRLGVRLSIDDRQAGPTPWDVELEPRFDAARKIVHEEFSFVGQLARASSLEHLDR